MFYLIAKAASEEPSRIVTCSGLDCNICGLFKIVANLFSWLLFVSAAAAILFVVVGGLIYIGANGRDSWMAQAKRTVFWAITGFAFVLLAHLAIRVSFIVMGATNNGVFDSFECNSDGGGSSALPKVESKRTSDLAREVKNNGSGGGELAQGTSVNELNQIQNGLSQDDLLIYALEKDSSRKPIIALTKTSHWFDWDLIQSVSPKTTSYLINEANAANDNSQGGLEATTEEEYRQMAAQIVEALVKNNQKVITIVTKISNGSLIGGISVGELYNTISNFGNCVGSGGTWYLFSNSCTFNNGACGATAVDCSSLGNSGGSINGCKCPDSMCRKGNECSNK